MRCLRVLSLPLETKSSSSVQKVPKIVALTHSEMQRQLGDCVEIILFFLIFFFEVHIQSWALPVVYF